MLPFGLAAWSGNGSSAENTKETPGHLEQRGSSGSCGTNPGESPSFLVHPKPNTQMKSEVLGQAHSHGSNETSLKGGCVPWDGGPS